MVRVLEYSPSKKIIALYFAIAFAAGLLSQVLFYGFASLILIWFICKQSFSTYLNRKERIMTNLEESAELMGKSPEERMEAILKGINDDKK